ncbi:MAG: alpha/beta hydrolase fold domain-containing protein [bacterium]|nr:alpha/beta hydrolase fold domain-containing protein [bacterium]
MKPMYWKASLLAIVAVAASVVSAQDKLPAPFHRFDGNSDGRLDMDEVPENVRQRVFPRFDANGDGVLDAVELKKVVENRQQKRPTTDGVAPSRERVEVATHGLVQITRDVDYATGPAYGDIRGKLDLYLPKGRKDFPFIIIFHGGGLTNGSKASMEHIAKRFAMEGFGVAAPNYRLAPEVQYPAFIEDAAKAFRYIYDHLPEYGGDRDRLYVSGGSAGGYLTALLTLDERYLKAQGLSPANVHASMPISGLMDVSRAGARVGVVWDDDPRTVKEASPMTYVRKGAPPILIMFADGETEDRHQQNVLMYEALEKAGHPDVAMIELRNRTHNTIAPNLPRPGDQALVGLLEFMKQRGARNEPLAP